MQICQAGNSLPVKCIKAADLFCGAGGTSTGLIEACADAGVDVELTAINHWDVAIATHTSNHPNVRHLCANLDAVDPRKLYKPGELLILWASPECMHHSIARGGKPINDQSRATAHCVTRWAEALLPRVILVENVKEFRGWGPCGVSGRPLKSGKGKTFMAWVGMLESLGYRVEWRVMCAADYGDPTTRERLFVQAVRGRTPIAWPEPTHAPIAVTDMLGARKAWVPARDIIDWELPPGRSVFDDVKPFAENTLRRVMVGFERFCLAPFIVPQFNSAKPRSVERPLQTVTCGSRGNRLAQPYLVQVAHGNGNDKAGNNRRVRSLKRPLPTICGNNDLALCEPFLLGQQSGHFGSPVKKPAPTVATAGAIALVQPFIVPKQGVHGGNAPRSVNRPLNTVIADGRVALVSPYILAIDHQGGSGNQVRSIAKPLSTMTTKQRHAIVQPYLVKFYGTGVPASVAKPLDTVTTKDRFGLVMPLVEIDGKRYLVDLRLRMLQPHELAGAQGFPRDYQFSGKKTEVVKQIGNAVPKNLAKAIVGAVLKNILKAK